MANINEFVERVKAAAQDCGCVDNLPASRATNTGRPVVSWFNGTSQEIHDLDKVLAQARSDEAASRRAVCVLENVDWDWIGVIGSAWKLEPVFFVEHGANPAGDDAWTTLFPQNREMDVKKGPSKHKYIDGVLEHHCLASEDAALEKMKRGLANSAYRRRCWVPASSYPPSSCTRMSYCRVNANLYLFLVDPPLGLTNINAQLHGGRIMPSMRHLRLKATLRVQCATSRGGIMLPQLLKKNVYSCRQALHSIFKHSWHLKILFDQRLVRELAINRGELLHLMSASLHQTNLKAIDKEIKAISFQELRSPDMATNAKLLTLREILSELVTGTTETSKYVPSHVRQFYEALYSSQSNARDYLNFHSPVEKLAAIKQQANDLERFLMDSFQLLMSSLSVIETQTGAQQTRLSMEQAARTARLTQLAFIYIPLTFVTSVFGMNVKGLSDPLPPVWVCFVTLIVVVVATAAIFGGYELTHMLRRRAEHLVTTSRTTIQPYDDIRKTRDDLEKSRGGMTSPQPRSIYLIGSGSRSRQRE